MTERKLALHSLKGDPVAYYQLTMLTTHTVITTQATRPCHHLVLVDRSRSMAQHLGDLKHLLIKLLTLEEYRDPESLLTLISYADAGQVSVHFTRVSLCEVMREGSEELSSIFGLESTSGCDLFGALEVAYSLIDPRELSLISLHSDGYLDPSRSSETLTVAARERRERRRKLKTLVSAHASPTVITNTITYCREDDVDQLAEIAQRGGGSCTPSSNLHEIYDALHQSAELLSARSRRVMRIDVDDADGWLLATPRRSETAIGVSSTEVLGLNEGEEGRLYLFKRLDPQSFAAHDAPEINPFVQRDYIGALALSRFLLAQHQLNLAKYTMISARSALLVRHHLKALTTPELTEMAAALDQRVLRGAGRRDDPALPKMTSPDQPTVIDVLQLLHDHHREVKVLRAHLESHYERRTLRRVIGSRDDEGTLIEPELSFTPAIERDYLRLCGVEINSYNASVNLITSERVTLVDHSGNQRSHIAGIELDELDFYRTYSVISDGALHLTTLKVRVESKSLFAQLARWGLVRGGYRPTTYHELDFSDLPLVLTPPSQTLEAGLFERLAHARFVRSFLNAALGGYSDRFTDKQLTALRAHHLTPKLHVNLPTTSPYLDLRQARCAGLVGVRQRHHIDLGNHVFTGLSKLPSANALLRSTYDVTVNGVKLDKPSIAELSDAEITVKSQIKTTEARALLKPLLDELLGLEDGKLQHLPRLLNDLDLDDAEREETIQVLCTPQRRDEMSFKVLGRLREALLGYIQAVYTEQINPLVFYLGATGVLPDNYQARNYTSAEAQSVIPTLKIPRDLEEGSIFDLGGSLTLSVRLEEVLYSTDHVEPRRRRSS